jgi:hypothetical protein
MGLLLILFVMAGVAEAGAWVCETVDSVGYTGEYNSIVMDSSGNPHISYYDGSNYNLKYARWDGSAWQIETVDSVGHVVGYYTSIALDPSGNPHISYYDRGYGDLRYARWDGSAWQIEVVDSGGDVGRYTSLALDFSGNSHISYYDSGSGNLKYARWDGSAWQIEAVDSSGNVYKYTSLALDPSGNPHISYSDYSHDLKYARWDGSAWHLETVDSVGYTGEYNSIVMDSSGRPHISYLDYSNEYLKYARWDGSAWQIEAVDSSGNVIGHISLALDPSDNPHISYCDYGGNLRYVRWDGSAWQTEAVGSGSVGGHISLALNSSGNPYISYNYGYGNALKYAYWDTVIDDLSLAAEVVDEGVLLSWSIVGDEPVSISVLRKTGSNETLHPLCELYGSATSWLDVSVEAGVEYAYYLEVTEFDGTVSRFGPSEVFVPGVVRELTLSDPYPNPADKSLTIRYELSKDGTINLSIYDLSGRLVETLVSGEQTAGRHSVNWDSSVAVTGVYLLRLEAEGNAITKRAVISQ